LASFRGKVEKNMDVTDEDLAVRINSYILSQNDATKDLPNDEKKKFAKAILARDLTVMDNDDYFERMARNVNVAAIADAVMKDKVLKFDIGITDAEGTVKSTLKPLQRVQAENLRTINDINVAVQFKRIDWMAAFVLFMSLEQLGEKGSDRCEHLKKTAKELLAKEMGLDPYDQQVEEAFEDQIVKLKPYIEDYYKKSAEARDTTENQSSQMLVDSIHAWLKEALKMEEIGETDFELVMKDLEDMGYFKAKRKLADGTVGIMPKDQALAYLKAMFKDTLKEQEKEDRKHYLEEASKKAGADVGATALGLGLGAMKFGIFTTPWAIVRYAAKPLHLPLSLIRPRNWLSPIRGIKEGFSNIVTSTKQEIHEDATKVSGKAKELKERAKKSAVAAAKRTWGIAAQAGWKDLGEHAYKKRTHSKSEKLKKIAELHKKRLGKSALTLTESPFIDPKSYKKSEAKAA
jgi:hypothetical protein